MAYGVRRGWFLLFVLITSAAARADEGSEAYYRYVGPSGRPVFVNGLERVPVRYRKHARPLDLSKVSLNTELGAGLRAEVEREYARLKSAGAAVEEPASGVRVFLARLWADHKLALGIVAALVLVMALSRPLGRRLGGGKAAWVVLLVAPAVAVFVLLSALVTQVARHNAAVARMNRVREEQAETSYLKILEQLRAEISGTRPAPDAARWITR